MPRLTNEQAEQEGFQKTLESLFASEEKREEMTAKQDYASVRKMLHRMSGDALFTLSMTAFFLGITSSALREARKKYDDPFSVSKSHAARKDQILRWWATVLKKKSGLVEEIEGGVGLDLHPNPNLFIVFKDKKTGRPVVLCNSLITSVSDELLSDTLRTGCRIVALTPEKAIEKPWAVHQEKAAYIQAYRKHLEAQHREKLLWLDREQAQSKAIADRAELDASTVRR
jgi:cbb3-type cytochrome oxidase subunit 3